VVRAVQVVVAVEAHLLLVQAEQATLHLLLLRKGTMAVMLLKRPAIPVVAVEAQVRSEQMPLQLSAAMVVLEQPQRSQDRLSPIQVVVAAVQLLDIPLAQVDLVVAAQGVIAPL
jgi:hypothetical protein